jgi:PAS domain S-box-containing protein
MSEKSERIFIVEDEALILMGLKDSLTQLGYTVCGTAARGERALKEIPAAKPDLVLMDIHLGPGINGIEVAARLREECGVPVVFLTAYSDDRLLSRAISTGPYGYLVKPVGERELHATIQAALYQYRTGLTLREANAEMGETLDVRTSALQGANLWLWDLFEYASDLIQSVDAEGEILFVNHAWRRTLGYSEEELEGRKIFEFIHADCREHCGALFQRLLKGEEVGLVSVSFVSKDGRRIDLEGNISVRIEQGKPVATRGIFRDVSHLRQADAALRLSEHRFSQLFHADPVPTCLSDLATGEFLDVNEQFLRVIGRRREEVVGRCSSDMGLWGDDAAAREKLAGVLVQAGGFENVERAIPLADGRHVEVSAAARLVEIDGRKCVLSTFTDITARKAAEAQVRRLNENLERLVEERTGALIESEERFRAIFNGSVDGIAVVREEKIAVANAALVGMLGYGSEAELVGRPVGDLIVPEERGAAVERHRRRMAGEPVESRYEIGLLRKDGGRLTVEAHASRFDLRDASYGVVVLRDITAVKIAQQEILRSKELFETLSESAPVGIFLTDAEGRCTHTNSRWREFAGLGPDEEFNYGWLKAIHPEDRERVATEWQRLFIEMKIPFRSEYRFRHPGGAIRWVMSQAVELRDADGGTRGCVGSVTDITERKLMEQALHFLGGTFDIPTERFFGAVTLKLAELFGVEFVFVGRVVGEKRDRIRTIAWWVDGRLVENVEYSLAGTPCQGVVGKRACVWEHDVRRHFPEDAMLGELKIESYVGVPLFSPGGHPIGHIGVMSRSALENGSQIEAILNLFAVRTAAEIERQRSQRQFQDLFEFSPDAIVMTDQKGIITMINQQAAQMFGWTREELTGRSIETLIPRDIAAAHVEDRERYMKSAVHRPMGGGRQNLRALRKDGTVFPVDISLRPMETDDGMMVAAAVRDISERVKAEKHALRTQRLEAIGTLAGGLAHDLNNAMTPILMVVELLKMDYPESSSLIDTVESSARRGAEMVRQLLTFAKGSEGEQHLLQPRHLITEVEKVIRGTFPKSIQLRTSYKKDLPAVVGDATQLHQVLLNLCVNARDAMPNGGILTLETDTASVDDSFASTLHEARPGEYVILRVGDTGTGIPPEIQERIFEPFFSTKGPDQGTGLGLSTVAGILRSHSGFIRLYSAPDKGTTFTVYLPVGSGKLVEKAAAQASGEMLRGDGRTVLVVDDELAVREVIRLVLRNLNFHVVTATDGTDALIQAAELRKELCLVITDLHMPHMDGLGFVRALKRMLPEVFIVVASGRLEERMGTEFTTLGVNGLLDKPFTQEQLIETLKAVLKKKPGRV